MIKLNNVCKTYNKKSANSLKVVDNTTLTLPERGFVTLLGASGSGKTTLLNVIGGLDSFDSGSITYGEQVMQKFNMTEIDKFRRKNVGYVFQNYLLLENVSVYENLQIALDIIGVTDVDEQEKRIKYVLEAVGLYKFRKKMAGNLSGGQQQRVSIARALLKDATLIIADEPTGNLDSANSVEIMNVLKKVSEQKLVLLVTHDKTLATFYSDKIISVCDGKITSEEDNVSVGQMANSDDRKIYLKDLREQTHNGEAAVVNVYCEDEPVSTVLPVVNVVIKNGTVYVSSDRKTILATSGNVEFIDDHRKQIEVKDVADFSFDTSFFSEKQSKKSTGRLGKQLKSSFHAFFSPTKKEKVFRVVFGLIGILMCVCMILAATYYEQDDTYYIKDKYYCFCNPKEFYVEFPSKELLNSFIDSGLITDVVYTQLSYSSLGNNADGNYHFNSVSVQSVGAFAPVLPFSMVKDASLLAGRVPTSFNEVVLSKDVADEFLESFQDFTYADLCGLFYNNRTICGVSSCDTHSVYARMPNAAETNSVAVKESCFRLLSAAQNGFDISAATFTSGSAPSNENEVVFIADNNTKIDVSFAVGDVVSVIDGDDTRALTVCGVAVCNLTTADDTALFLTNDVSCLNYGATVNDEVSFKKFSADDKSQTAFYFTTELPADESVVLVSGRQIAKEGECLVSAYSCFDLGDTVDGQTVVGKYLAKTYANEVYSIGSRSLKTSFFVFTAPKTALKFAFSTLLDRYGENSIAFALDKDAVNKVLTENNSGVVADTLYSISYNQSQLSRSSSMSIMLVLAGALLCLSLVYMYFSVKGKMISEIYDVGVYRSLGASRSRIVSKYAVASFVQTTFTVVLGYLICCVFYETIASYFNILLTQTVLVSGFAFLIVGLVVAYVASILIGILPVALLLKKTPAEINSKYDI